MLAFSESSGDADDAIAGDPEGNGDHDAATPLSLTKGPVDGPDPDPAELPVP
ncbi:MAG: hypothetical protein M1839_008359 [Geoglossum umbratile]|nr:MAG: hypothetical protein M1839_008359 [Geoglossum umbratile]